MEGKENRIRCDWAMGSDIYKDYHDKEWGAPLHGDRKLFEFLVLEGFQAGLSWITILKKREAFRKAFDNFDIQKVANYNEKKFEELKQNKDIVRNKLKIKSAITNAQLVLEIQKEIGSFDEYIWQFTEQKTIKNKWKSVEEVPAHTELSDMMSKTMKKKGFKFVGTTICYSFMQATGMINDHITSCWKH